MSSRNKSERLAYYYIRNYKFTDTRFPGYTGSDVNAYLLRDFCGGTAATTGTSNPDYKVKIARGQDASSAYRRFGGSATPAWTWIQTTVHGVDTGVPYTIIGEDYQRYIPPTPTSFPSTDGALSDLALEKVKRSIRRQAGSINIITPIAELHEFRSMIKSSATLTTGLLQTLVDIKRTKGKSAVKYATQAWLNFNFGIAPLLSDTRAAAAAVNDFMTRQSHSFRAHGTAGKVWTSNSSVDSVGSTSHASLSGRTQMVHNLEYTYTAGIELNIQAGNNYDAFSQFHLELGAIIPTFWELVPYSWVVDYFTTAGSFLDDVFLTQPGQTKYITLSRKYTCIGEFTLRHVVASNATAIQESGAGSWDYFDFERTLLSSLPHPALRFKTADEIGMHSINKLLNLSSILIGRKNRYTIDPAAHVSEVKDHGLIYY